MIRVLLVEDDAMIREMTRIFLESQKRFEVVCAASGEEKSIRTSAAGIGF